MQSFTSMYCQFCVSLFYSKLGEVGSECIWRNFSLFAQALSTKNYQNWWKFNGVLTKTIWTVFLRHSVHYMPNWDTTAIVIRPASAVSWFAIDSLTSDVARSISGHFIVQTQPGAGWTAVDDLLAVRWQVIDCLTDTRHDWMKGTGTTFILCSAW